MLVGRSASLDRVPCSELVYGAKMSEAESSQPTASGVTITLRPNGPMLVQGDVTVIGADGEEIDRGGRVAFCRCGASNTKPFCDASHKAAEFQAP
jgi:Iron-binding zinc finger CDGSH type